jgi:hypothetical protein
MDYLLSREYGHVSASGLGSSYDFLKLGRSRTADFLELAAGQSRDKVPDYKLTLDMHYSGLNA